MIEIEFVKTMASYNRWQNVSIYTAADGLSEPERVQDRGAFFGSIHKTLSHLLWGDQLWLSRFAGTPEPGAPSIPTSSTMVSSWDDLKSERILTDEAIAKWANELQQTELEKNLKWHSGAMNRDFEKPTDLLVVHFFNHQTHHRGQVHAMLTAAGAKPDDTDLPFMPPSFGLVV